MFILRVMRGCEVLVMGMLIFATSNRHKFEEAESVLKAFNINIKHANVSFPEIRAEECDKIAASTAEIAFKQLREHLIVEDSGLFIEALNGFPGTFSSWVFKKIGVKGLLKLLEGEKNRKAAFVSAVAFTDGKKTETFVGRADGKIAGEMLGENGFGFDPVFIPAGRTKTFAEDFNYKMKVSHRRKSLEKIAEWLKNKEG